MVRMKVEVGCSRATDVSGPDRRSFLAIMGGQEVDMAASNIRKRNVSSKATKRRTDEETLRSKTSRGLQVNSSSGYAPSFRPVFSLIFFFRVLSVALNTISDCDETYNYWEPLHYLMYGYAFQTWEYSPVYALRSYAYLLPHRAMGDLGSFLYGADKPATFYHTRLCLGMISAASEALFYRAIVGKFGGSVGVFSMAFLVSSSGMWIASTAFLPSATCMYLVMLVYAAWFDNRYQLAVVVGVVAVVVGWPFVGLIFVPLALDSLIHEGFVKSLRYGVVALLIVVPGTVLIDSHFYGDFPILASWNILKYNVFGGGGGAGSELYGTEPFSYYLINLFLNLNLSFVLGLIAFPVVTGVFLVMPLKNKWQQYKRVCLYLAPMYAWFCLMQSQAHKEERFMFPIYPLFAFSAGLCLRSVVDLGSWLCRKVLASEPLSRRVVWLGYAAIVVSSLLSASRVYSIVENYRAPMIVYGKLYAQLSEELQQAVSDRSQRERVCVGKEWHRFPTSFFTPSNKTEIAFLKSEFAGQLPQPFQLSEGTSAVPDHFNDMNLEETSRYVDLESCDYIVDLEVSYPPPSSLEPNYTAFKDFEVLFSHPFLNAQRSDRLARAFYIPFYSEKRKVFDRYVALRRVRKAETLA